MRQVVGGVVTLCNAEQVDKIVATIVAKSRIKFYFLSSTFCVLLSETLAETMEL